MTIMRSTRFALSVATVCLGSLVGLNQTALGQLEPDDTLGEERSQIREISPVDFDIEGGARRGNNLFHSFREFNVDEGGSVYFANPDGVENILSRVTGGNPSNILGTLGVRGEADLFLVNPNGILFGPNASLDVQGSFAATTADGIQFGEQGFFSARNPETPGLLNVNPSAYFFNQLPTGDITVQSVTPIIPRLGINGLFVPSGENLTLLGGNINIGGGLNALGGRINIGAVASTGIIGFNSDGSLNFPASVQRGDVFFTDEARADVRTLEGGGDIAVKARRLTLTNGSLLLAGIPGRGNSETQAGDIVLEATERILVNQTSAIINSVAVGAIGNAGNIEIVTPVLEVLDRSQLTARTRGQGNAGSVIISASDRITVNQSGIYSYPDEGAVGNGGNIEITTGSLEATNRALIFAEVEGRGSGGDIIVNARDRILADGETFFVGGVDSRGVGNGGDIIVNTGSLSFTGGSLLRTTTNGRGNAGNIFVNARDHVSFAGTAEDGNPSTAAFSNVNQNAVGRAGNVEITAGSLSVLNGAQLASSTEGQGDAGSVIIRVRDRALFQGNSLDGNFSGSALSTVEENAIGNGGNVEITAGSLEVRDGAQLLSVSQGQGNAGDIIIHARDRVIFDGESPNQRRSSTATSRLDTNAVGQGGDIRITTGSLFIRNEGDLNASTLGQGNAGDVIVNVRDDIVLDRGGIFSASGSRDALGQGGTIRITTGSLRLTNGGQILTFAGGRGDAGDVIINARHSVAADGREPGSNLRSGIDSSVESDARGDGGNVDITTGSLSFTNDAEINTSTSGRGNAGDVSISASDRVTFNRGFALSIIEPTGRGAGGDIEITAPILEIVNGGQLAASTNGQGNAGNVIVSASDRVLIDGVASSGFSSGVFTSTAPNSTGRGGRVTLTTPELRVANGAVINALTANNQLGGGVVIEADQFTALNGGQVITTALGSGRAGTITVNADRILLSGTDATYGDRLEQFGRRIVVNQSNRSGLFANTGSNSTGDGGRITANSNNLTLENGARISAQSQGTGKAGDIRLNALEQLQLTNSDIATTAVRSSGGDITINADRNSGVTILRGDSDITTNSQGNGGNITLQGGGIVAFDDSDILARSQDARGGNITLAPFFGANTAFESEPPFDGNDRVDINADGSVAAGTITTPDTSFIQNSLTELPDTAIDPDTLVANSCVVRSQEEGGTFIVTGSEGLPQRPGDATLPTYPTGEVRSVPSETSDESQTWQMGDPIAEPHGAYQLEDGRMVLSRECGSW